MIKMWGQVAEETAVNVRCTHAKAVEFEEWTADADNIRLRGHEDTILLEFVVERR